MNVKKITIISVIFVLIVGYTYFKTHYAVIDNEIYKTDITYLHIFSLDDSEIKEINKCTEIEKMFVSKAVENSVSGFTDFHNLNDLTLLNCEISGNDTEKISKFDNLNTFCTLMTDIDLQGFNNNMVFDIVFFYSKIKNFKALSECSSLKKLAVYHSEIADNCIVTEDGKYIMKDSSVFKNFDYTEELRIFVNKIEDISGILEMDSLNVFEVYKGTVSEDNVKLLEDNGISVVYNDTNE